MTDPQPTTNSAPPRPALDHIPDANLWQAVAGTKRVRLWARLAGLVLAAASVALGGPFWLLGAFLGWLVVEINLSLLVRALAQAAQWRGRSLWPTLGRFYLAFAGTAAACFLIISNGWGEPLAFLMGLLSFFFGLVLGLVSLAVKKPEQSS